jgi:hypothetical protein
VLQAIKRLFRRSAPLKEILSVEFDNSEVRVRVLAELEPAWNQTFEWNNIRRVCFKDGGMMNSDIIYISLKQPDTVCTVPTEAQGGDRFFGALCEKGFFPESVWRRAVGDTSGGLHCWPEE